jgi:ceramide glucosyltransferase
MAEKAVGELYWVSDSNIRVEKNTLKRLVHEYLVKGSKIIFSPIRATGSRTIGSIIENTYINLFLSGNIITAWELFKQQIIVGKSILIERNALNYFGGFSYFKEYLAEDYMMGKTFTRAKIPISTNFTWVTNYNSSTTIKEFFYRAERWAKLRFHLKFHVYIMELLLNPIMLAIIFSLIMGRTRGLLVVGTALPLKILLEFLNFYYINKEDRKKLSVVLVLPFCILLKDILLFAVYFTPFFSRTVKWRGGRISIGKNTRISADVNGDHVLLDGV